MWGIRSLVSGTLIESIRAEGTTVFSPAKRAKTNDQNSKIIDGSLEGNDKMDVESYVTRFVSRKDFFRLHSFRVFFVLTFFTYEGGDMHACESRFGQEGACFRVQ